MTVYGITTDYEYTSTHKRERLAVWSPPFFSVFEGDALSLPNGAGYMVTTYNGDKVRVSCPSPRTAENYQAVDDAISAALNGHHDARGSIASTYGSRIDADVDARERQEAIDALAAAKTYSVGQTVTLLDTHPGDGGWSSAYVESVHGTTYGVRVQGHSLYYVTADKLDKYRGRY